MRLLEANIQKHKEDDQDDAKFGREHRDLFLPFHLFVPLNNAYPFRSII